MAIQKNPLAEAAKKSEKPPSAENREPKGKPSRPDAARTSFAQSLEDESARTRELAREKEKLWAALEKGSEPELKAVLETPGGRAAALSPCDNMHSEWRGMTPLRAALEMEGADPVLAERLCPFSDLSSVAFPMRSSLAWAVMRNMSSRMFEACLAVCDPLAIDPDGSTILEMALLSSGVERIKRLVSVSDPTVRGRGGNTLLMIAASRRDEPEIIELLLQTNDPKAKNNYGETALMLAAAEGCPAALRPLLAASDPDARDNSFCTALMHFAAADIDAVLMSHATWVFAGKSNPQARGREKALYVEEMGALLLSVSDPAALNKEGRTTFQMAVSNGNFEISEFLAPHANERELEWAQRHFQGRPESFEAVMPRAAAQKERFELRREARGVEKGDEKKPQKSRAEKTSVRKL